MNINEALAEKTLVMIVGPSAIGKSTLMDRMTRISADFAYVRSFTTRLPRAGERSHYDFISREAAEQLQHDHQTITCVEHPATHDLYGTTARSYPGRYNLLDTLSGSVMGYRKLPFKRTVTIAVTAPIDQWQQWFIDRYPEPNSEARKRLDEAVLSIEWSLGDPETHWVTNQEGALDQTARAIINAVHSPSKRYSVPSEPHAMLELIKGGVWHRE